MKRSQMFVDIILVVIAIVGAVLLMRYTWGNTTRYEQAHKEPEQSDLTTKTQPTMNNDKLAKLGIEILTEGTGEGVQSGQTALVDYTGMLTDGTVFDSSIPRGQPFEVHLGRGDVIEGWDLGIVGMKTGEKRKLTIPPELGYGASGFPGVIPPNATLIFEVTLQSYK